MAGDGGVVAVIPARGGSKGVPRKNIRPMAGRPLIAFSIETALSCKLIDRVVVSTDDFEIADIAKQYGAEVPFMRPAELAQDDSPEWLTWQHTIRELNGRQGKPKMEVFVCVPPTSPLREVEDLDNCILAYTEGDADLVITVKPAVRNPYFNMVTLDDDGNAQLVIPPQDRVFRRQDAPSVYDMATVAYVARPQFVLSASSMFEGRVKAVTVPPERALDIDTELDFQIAELLLAKSQPIRGGADSTDIKRV